MFKVNNKDVIDVVLVSLTLTLNIFHSLSSVFLLTLSIYLFGASKRSKVEAINYLLAFFSHSFHGFTFHVMIMPNYMHLNIIGGDVSSVGDVIGSSR